MRGEGGGWIIQRGEQNATTSWGRLGIHIITRRTHAIGRREAWRYV
jgi:hypothetical protein